MTTLDVLSPAPAAGVLTDEALAFVGALHERFEPRRRELLATRGPRRPIAVRGPVELHEIRPSRADRRKKQGDCDHEPPRQVH